MLLCGPARWFHRNIVHSLSYTHQPENTVLNKFTRLHWEVSVSSTPIRIGFTHWPHEGWLAIGVPCPNRAVLCQAIHATGSWLSQDEVEQRYRPRERQLNRTDGCREDLCFQLYSNINRIHFLRWYLENRNDKNPPVAVLHQLVSNKGKLQMK